MVMQIISISLITTSGLSYHKFYNKVGWVSSVALVAQSRETEWGVLTIAWFNSDCNHFFNWFRFITSSIYFFNLIGDLFKSTVIKFKKWTLNLNFNILTASTLLSSTNNSNNWIYLLYLFAPGVFTSEKVEENLKRIAHKSVTSSNVFTWFNALT